MKKIISIALLIAVVVTMAIAASAGSLGQKFPKGDVAYVEPGSITIDGIRDAAYSDGAVIVTDTYRPGYVSENGSMNTTWLLWDGSSLYIYSEVKDNTPLEASLVQFLTSSDQSDCLEYFIVWDNSDGADGEIYEPDSFMDLFQYRVCYEDSGHGGWFLSSGSDADGMNIDGFADLAEDTNPFSDTPGAWKAGKMVPAPYGYNIEGQINMPKSNKLGVGNYTYGEGWKIAFITQQIDWTVTIGDFDNFDLPVTEVGVPSGGENINKSSAWDVVYYDYVELKGGPSASDTTKAPETTEAPKDTESPDTTAAPDTTEAPATQAITKAPVVQNPQTSDMAIAGAAILATLALAGVVVAKKVNK